MDPAAETVLDESRKEQSENIVSRHKLSAELKQNGFEKTNGGGPITRRRAQRIE